MMDPPVSYLESTVPAAACEMAIVFRSVGYAYFACRPIDLNTVSLLRYFPRPTIVMARMKGTNTSLWSGLVFPPILSPRLWICLSLPTCPVLPSNFPFRHMTNLGYLWSNLMEALDEWID